MRSRCHSCGKYWNISILQKIPKTGYVCPYCTKKGDSLLKIPGKQKGQVTVKNGNMFAFIYGSKKKKASQGRPSKRSGKK